MRWMTTMAGLALAVLLAGPALAQEHPMDHGAMGEGHAGMMGEGHGMMMHGMDMLTEHATELGLTEDQLRQLEGLDRRMETEMDRHHAEMESIHESAMAVLTDEQKGRIHEMMESMHEEHAMGRGMKAHGGACMDDDDDKDEANES